MHYEHAAAVDAAPRDLIESAYAVLASVGLEAKRDQRAAALSHGDQRKLEVAMMMALEPDVFMFDEPTAGMSVDEVPVVLDLIARLKRDATKTSCWSSTRWTSCARSPTASSCCTNGRLVADGEPAAVIASPIVQEAYLGMAPGGRPHDRTASRSTASTPTSAAITSCRASISTRPRARRRCCSAATAPARRRRCARSWACGGPRAARSRSATPRSSRPDGERRSRAPASPTCPRRWRCSPTSPCART